jgi:hypothetical protein
MRYRAANKEKNKSCGKAMRECCHFMRLRKSIPSLIKINHQFCQLKLAAPTPVSGTVKLWFAPFSHVIEPSLWRTKNLNSTLAPPGTETVSSPLPAAGIGTGPTAPFQLVAQFPNSATPPESMRTSELANAGVPLMLKLTGINADVLTLNGTASDVIGP